MTEKLPHAVVESLLTNLSQLYLSMNHLRYFADKYLGDEHNLIDASSVLPLIEDEEQARKLTAIMESIEEVLP